MIASSPMITLARKLWFRLPFDGAGVIPLAPRRQRLFQRVAARGFWSRLPRGSRLVARLAARLLWLAACPVKTAMAGRGDSSFTDLWAALWDWLGPGPDSPGDDAAAGDGQG